jgi:hypothetical protein
MATMRLLNGAARLTLRDVSDLNYASEALAAAAEQVKRANPGWGPAVVQLLIQANDTVVRLQNKGAGAFARYMEKRGMKPPGADAGELNSSESANQAPDARHDKEP